MPNAIGGLRTEAQNHLIGVQQTDGQRKFRTVQIGGYLRVPARWLACRARSTGPRPDGRWRNATTPFELQFA